MGFFWRLRQKLGLVRPSSVAVRNELTVQALRELAIKKQVRADELADTIIRAAVNEHNLQAASLELWESLSPREQQVTALAVRGYTNAQIGAILNLSVSTVKTYISTAYHKMGVSGRAGLVDRFRGLDLASWVVESIGDY